MAKQKEHCAELEGEDVVNDEAWTEAMRAWMQTDEYKKLSAAAKAQQPQPKTKTFKGTVKKSKGE